MISNAARRPRDRGRSSRHLRIARPRRARRHSRERSRRGYPGEDRRRRQRPRAATGRSSGRPTSPSAAPAAAERLDRIARQLVAAAAGRQADGRAFADRSGPRTTCSLSAPLRWPPAEQARRAGQLTRFLGLVPIEYARGVAGGTRHGPDRDPGGDHVPRRRRERVRRPAVIPRAHRRRRDEGDADRARPAADDAHRRRSGHRDRRPRSRQGDGSGRRSRASMRSTRTSGRATTPRPTST